MGFSLEFTAMKLGRSWQPPKPPWLARGLASHVWEVDEVKCEFPWKSVQAYEPRWFLLAWFHGSPETPMKLQWNAVKSTFSNGSPMFSIWNVAWIPTKKYHGNSGASTLFLSPESAQRTAWWIGWCRAEPGWLLRCLVDLSHDTFRIMICST